MIIRATHGIFNSYQSTAAFSPNSISNIFGWWRADLGVNTASDTTWLDQSGNGNTFLSNGNRPTLTTGSLAGKECLSFDGVNDFLTLNPASPEPFATGNFTVVLVSSIGLCRGLDGGVGSWSLSFPLDDGFTVSIYDNPVLTGVGSTYIYSLPLVSAIRTLTMVNSGTNTTQSIYTNGVAVQTNKVDPYYNLRSTGTNKTINFGINNINGFISGNLYEVIIYSKIVAGTEFTNLHAYLSTRYGL